MLLFPSLGLIIKTQLWRNFSGIVAAYGKKVRKIWLDLTYTIHTIQTHIFNYYQALFSIQEFMQT